MHQTRLLYSPEVDMDASSAERPLQVRCDIFAKSDLMRFFSWSALRKRRYLMVSLEKERHVFLLLRSALRIKEGFSPAQRCERECKFCFPRQPCERYGEERLSPVTLAIEFVFRSAFLGRVCTFFYK